MRLQCAVPQPEGIGATDRCATHWALNSARYHRTAMRWQEMGALPPVQLPRFCLCHELTGLSLSHHPKHNHPALGRSISTKTLSQVGRSDDTLEDFKQESVVESQMPKRVILLPVFIFLITAAAHSQSFNRPDIPTGSAPQQVAVADFNRDGKPDIVVANGGSVSILLGNGDGTFRAPITTTVNAFPRALAVVDLNGDGVPDSVSRRSRSTYCHYRAGPE